MRHSKVTLACLSVLFIGGWSECKKRVRPQTTPGDSGGIFIPQGGGPPSMGVNPSTTSATAATNNAVGATATVSTTAVTTNATTTHAATSASTTASTAAGSGLCGGMSCPESDRCVENVNGSFCTDGSPGAPCASNSDCQSGVCPTVTFSCR